MFSPLKGFQDLCELSGRKTSLKQDMSILKRLQQEDVLSSLDVHLARFLSGLSNASDEDILLSIALVSSTNTRGDVCLDLCAVAGRLILEKRGTKEDEIKCPELGVWRQKLESSPIVGIPGMFRPLILDQKNRLYFYRYWEYEHTLCRTIQERIDGDKDPAIPAGFFEKLNRLFPQTAEKPSRSQKLAVVIPALKRFSVISGGPGTGKTTLVAKIIALLIDLHSEKKLNIFLSAPTGKAAAGLRDSIRRAKETLSCNDIIKSLIPEETYTIHRLLGPIPRSPYFRYNATNKLPADVLVVDEASMVDLALMAKLMQAIPNHTRVILIGDKDQLASVESGSVLGDICNHGRKPGYSETFFAGIMAMGGESLFDHMPIRQKPAGIGDHIVILEKSYRFSSNQGIGGVSRAVNNGQCDAVMEILRDPTNSQVVWKETESGGDLVEQLSQQVLPGYKAYLRANSPEEALSLFGRLQVICAIRKGPYGVEALNRIVEQILHHEGLIRPQSQWYAGRPILINRNHYDLGLFNGDLGILMTDPETDEKELFAFFASRTGEFRRIPPHRLPEHETAYAVTVHKSQGAEFDMIHLVLPDRDSPVLTRELLYTGITRAKKQAWLWAGEPVLRTTIARKIERSSGLRDALWDE